MNRSIPFKKPVQWLLALLALLLAVAPSASVTAAPSQGQGPSDAVEMAAFLDDLLARQMAEHHIAGAAVAVVKDGELFFAKGYGYADLESEVLVDPELTLFKIGSLTKLFTWTAVMQLVEQGKLDLDADINTYLDFQLPDTYPQPVTLRHLMTHTAGFEDRHTDFVTLEIEHSSPPNTWLAAHIPARVRPPGEIAAYSNYGAALAGAIVARVAGKPYSQYVQEHILQPLGMRNTTAQLAPPADLARHESVGYTYVDGAFQRFPRLFNPEDLFPAGVIRSTALDMARFMIAHLQDGLYRDAGLAEVRILNAATARQMHATLYTPDPRLLGTTYGFFEFNENGQRVIGHSGGAEPMESMLLLLPDQKLGVFVVYNSTGAGELNRQHFGFQRAFFDHFFPAAAVEPIHPPADFAAHADRFVGGYQLTQSSYTTLEKLLTLMTPIAIENPSDGTLLLKTPYGDWRIVEESPLFFRQVDGPFHFVFREDGKGQITHFFADYTPMFAFEKLPWYAAPDFNMALLLVSLLAFVSMLLVALLRYARSRRGGILGPASGGERMAYPIVVGLCILNLLFVTGTLLWGEQNLVPVFGVTPIFKIVLGLGVFSTLLTAVALVYAVLAWKDGYWGAAFRTYYSLVTVAGVAFVWFLHFWNLLGWRY